MNQAFVKAYQAKYKAAPDNCAGMGYALEPSSTGAHTSIAD